MFKIRGGVLHKSLSLILALGLLFNQVPLSYAQGVDQNALPQENALDTPTKTASDSNEPTAAPAVPQGETEAFLTQSPLQTPQIHTTIAEEEKIRKKSKKPEKSRDLNRYSFNHAVASLQNNLATAVIVTNLNEKNLKELLSLEMEVGIAVLHGEVILFTSGNTTEIRVQAPVLELLKEASLISHTHPAVSGNESGPSADDIALAVQDPLVEYVLTNGGVYSYNALGLLNGGVPSDFKTYLEALKTARRNDRTQESRGSVKARGILNEFIYQMDLLNDELTKDEAYFRFSGTAAPNAGLTAANLTLLPGNPQITPISSSPASASVQTNGFTGMTIIYDTNTPGWAGGGYTFDDFGTVPVETVNLSSLTQLVLGLQGDPTQVKLEVIDASGAKDSVILTGISSSSQQFWSIPVSQLSGVNLSQIRTFYFIVEGLNLQGSLDIEIRELNPDFALPDASNPAPTITQAPLNSLGNRPTLGTFASGDGSSAVSEVFSQSFARLTYDGAASGSFGGFYLNYDNSATTGTVETIDFSSLFSSGFVFRIDNAGSPVTQAFLQLRDNTGATARIALGNIQNFGQLYKVLANQFAGIDTTKISEIVLGIDGAVSGGELSWDLGNWDYVGTLLPDGSLPLGAITTLPLISPTQRPTLNTFASGDGSTATADVFSETFARLTYTGTGAGSFGGFSINYDNLGTIPKESIDFSNLYPTGFVFEVDSPGFSISNAFLQLRDATDKTSRVNIGDILNFGQLYKATASNFFGIDTTKITEVVFGIEGIKTGDLSINLGEWAFIPTTLPDPTLTQGDITQLPLNSLGQRAILNTFASPDNAGTVGINESATVTRNVASPTFATVTYNGNSAASFGGAYINYDDPATAGATETINFTTLYPTGFVFKMDSPSAAITAGFIQLRDNTGATARINIGNISAAGQFYKVLANQFFGIDTTKIVEIVYGIEGTLNGNLNIDLGLWDSISRILPDVTNPTVTKLPLNGLGQRVQLNTFASADGSTASANIFSQTFAQLAYTGTGANSFGGYSVGYDNPATAGTVESIDFSTLYATGFVFEADSPSNAIQNAFVQIRDNTGATAKVNIGGITSAGQKWKLLPALFTGVDLTKIAEIVVGVEGNQTGTLSLNLGDWNYIATTLPDPTLTGADITTLPLNSLGSRPGLNTFSGASTTVTSQLFSQNFARLGYTGTAAGSFGGYSIGYDNPATAGTVESINFSTLYPTGFVFEVDSPSAAITTGFLQVKDNTGATARINIGNIAGFGQRYKVLTSQFFGVDMTKITEVVFGVEGIKTGQLSLNLGNWTGLVNLSPDGSLTAANITNLPNLPSALFLKTPGTHPSTMTQVSDNQLNINYGALANGELLETLIDLGVAGQDLTGLAPIVFGLTGPAGSTVKVQVTDTDGDVAQVLLTGIDATQRFFKLQAGDFTTNNLAFDLSKVRLIDFVIDNTNVGAGAGSLQIFTDGLRTQVQIPATSGLRLSNVTVLPNYPKVNFVQNPGSLGATLNQPNPDQLDMTYPALGAGEFTGPSLDLGAAGQNLTSKLPLVFGATGAVGSSLKVELVDADGDRAVVVLTGLSATAKFFRIQAANLTAANPLFNITTVTNINFIVDNSVVGASGGTFSVFAKGLFYVPQITGTASGSLTTLSGLPLPSLVKNPAGLAATLDHLVSGTIGVNYPALGNGQFVGTALNFPTVQNLKGKTFTFGLSGPVGSSIKAEFVDINGNRTYVVLTGLSGTTKFFKISPSNLVYNPLVDFTKIASINFIADNALVGPNPGTFTVLTKGVNWVPNYNHNPILTLANVSVLKTNNIGQKPKSGLVSNAPGTNSLTQTNGTPQTLSLAYNVSVPGSFSGAGISFNDPATTAIEYGNLGSVSNLVFGLQGPSGGTTRVKIEFIDKNGVMKVVYLNGVTDVEQFYSIPLNIFTSSFRSNLQFINFVIDGSSVPAGALTGTLDIRTDGLA